MNDAFDSGIGPTKLREQAEQLAAEQLVSAASSLSNEEMMRQLHELQVSQIELEMQNVALAELEQLKNAFEISRDLYSQLYEQAPVSYFSLSRKGVITRVNVAACGLLRRDKDGLLARHFEQFIAPQAQGAFRRFLAAVFDSGARQVLEAQLFDGEPGRTGVIVRIEANVDAHSATVRMMVTELGDELARDSALRRAFLILDTIREGVMVTDSDNRIISVNPAFTSITGYLAEEAIGRDPSFLGGGTHPAQFYASMWQSLRQEGSWFGELVNRRKNGERFVESLSITPMRTQDGATSHFVGVFSDITERKLAEAAVRELHRELDQRVIDRTAELVRANQHLQLEVHQREQAQVALRDAERFFHSTIDSLTDRVLVLNQAGEIVHANQACIAFAGHAASEVQYLQFCETDRRWQRKSGQELASGIRAVIAGLADTYTLEYEFSTPAGARWSQARVSRFLGEGPLRVVVAHSDITERKLMDGALRQSHAQLRQLALHLETAKEDERKRISRDIHDELGQNLLALRIDISMLSARTEGSHPRLHGRVGAVLSNVDTTIKSVRGIMNELRPMALDLGLQAAIEWQVGDFRKRSGIACQLRIGDEALFTAIDGQVEIVLFRIVQEALSNVMRHAQASAVEIEFSVDAWAIHVVISDNGVGITPQQQRKSQCFGLIGIAERVTALGGQFVIGAPASGSGCRLSLQIPLRPAA
ncbi:MULTISPECIES: PAS domain S-box protein [unclassified Janthinobacterium]|uniref:sensor histidine kinase n=1 Tax=unclassified Janthinobacterium TaxID=2610881 RepID=UPI0018572C58|nr:MULTISPECIES: PAS domain S-box protein [unclassified Janthinobacterium]MBB5366979.1 PAS domain S-box-containing protein [Janthinobacterium sp. K2C7]MBB5380543.1 PAS domain S-box-containing protein [Janthinobacterium sp. K2Li3]MBB5385361.1 PAS domain S-box-containing protein [Janthinobacterium sp. K2E3]